MLLIEPTQKTPLIHFDDQLHYLKIFGICVPENSKEFFKPLFTYYESYIKLHNNLKIEIQLDYFNTSSSKELLNFLITVVKNQSNFNPLTIIWAHLDEDDEMIESGQILEEILNYKFEYKTVDN